MARTSTQGLLQRLTAFRDGTQRLLCWPALCWLCLCTLVLPAYAIPASNQYVADFWSSRDGLPEGAILSLFEDKEGWLWLGTECCLVRFDGEHFHILDEELAALGQYSFARTLSSDGGEGFWASFVGGVAHYDGEKYEWFGAEHGLEHPFVYALSGKRNPWIGTGGDGVWRLMAGRFERDPGFPKEFSGKINDLVMASDGVLWAATDKGVIRRFYDGVWHQVPFPIAAFNEVITQLAIDADGTVWVGSQQGLARYSDKDGFHTIASLEATSICTLTIDKANTLWVGGESAIYRVKDHQAYTVPHAITGKVTALLEDSHANIWVGTEAGLTRLKHSLFTTQGQLEGLPQNDIKAISPHHQSGLWLIDSRGGVGRLDDERYTEIAPAGTVLGSGMLGLTGADDGSLWLANNTLTHFTDGGAKHYTLPKGGAALVEPAHDGLWVGQTQPDGTSTLRHLPASLLTQQNRELSDVKAIPLPIDIRHLQRLYSDRQQHLWLATGGTGLLQLDKTGDLIKHWTQADGLPSNIVYSMVEDADGGFWIATRSGIAWLHDGIITNFAITLGAPIHSPVHMFLDPSDRLWITADDGIHLINRAAFMAAAKEPNKAIFERLFNTRDGLRSMVVSWRRGGQAVSADGTLSYATTNGLSQISPTLISDEIPLPPVVIESVRVGNRLTKEVELTINDRQQHVSVRYTVPDLNNAQRLEFRTRLKTHKRHDDAPWSPATVSRTVQFSNLAKGHYTLEVAARYKGQAWGSHIASLTMDVPPHFYERSLFHLIAVIAFMLLTLAWAKSRLLRAKRAEIVLRKRVTERTAALSHEIDVRIAAESRATELAGHLEERVRERTAALELAEMAVRRSEARFALAAKGAEDGIWDWDITLNTLYLSPRWQAILGYGEHQFPATLSAWLEAVHPEDIDRLRDLLVFSLGDDKFRYEYRIRHKDKHYIWVLTRGVVIRDRDGSPTRAAGSQTDISARKAADAQLAKSQTEDIVTRLPNRVLFADRLNQALLRGRQQKSLVAVIYLDIDQFRTVNEEYGHAIGDTVLQLFATRISETLRSTDSVARVGNDEFAILITEVANTEEANLAAERLRKILEAPLIIGDKILPLTCSMGLKLAHPGEATLESFLVDSEQAVVQAKSAGGGRMSLFDNKLSEETRERKSLEAELKRGLEKSEFVLHYQPLISSATGAVVGVEALARWQHPKRGLLAPYHFIGMLEACGLIVQFSEWVLQAACAQAKQWQQTLASPIRISINVPAHQLNDITLYNDINLALKKADIPADLLGIEIVETSVLETRPDIIQNLQRLRADGIQISIDDFGTGYSAFSYLNKLPIDRIKIDRSFCQGIPEDPQANSICSALLDMVRKLNMEPVVEGVETEAQYNFMCEKGTPIIQGYYFSKPLDVPTCTAYLKQNALKKADI